MNALTKWWKNRIWNKLKAWFKKELTISDLEWACGNFKPSSSAICDRELVFKNCGSSGVTFGFPSKDYWDSTHENHSLRCCAFYKSGDKYVGGFWEWGSKDRSYRSFDNIRGSYAGWGEHKKKFFASTEKCFVVFSKDGKHYTNIVKDYT